jgi:hypothetical protein
MTRDNLAAGDDLDPPHGKLIKVPDRPNALEIFEEVLRPPYLPRISGGRATWVVSSREPFAVCAQEWPAPKPIKLKRPTEWLLRDGKALRLHFSYIAQVDPNVVVDALSCCSSMQRLSDKGQPAPDHP